VSEAGGQYQKRRTLLESEKVESENVEGIVATYIASEESVGCDDALEYTCMLSVCKQRRVGSMDCTGICNLSGPPFICSMSLLGAGPMRNRSLAKTTPSDLVRREYPWIGAMRDKNSLAQ
jgi:hypothetical protein